MRMRIAVLVAVAMASSSAIGAGWNEAEQSQVFGHCIVGKVDSDSTSQEVDVASVECACATKEIVKNMSQAEFLKIANGDDAAFRKFSKIMDDCRAP